MKKYRVYIYIGLTLLLSLCLGLGIEQIREYRANPIRNRIRSVDPEELTGCRVHWIDMYDESFEYTETDPEKVRELYEAMAHMHFHQVPYETFFGGSYHSISLLTGEDEIFVFSYIYGPNVVIAIGPDFKYMAKITNEDDLNRRYNWSVGLTSLVIAAEKAHAERVEAEEAAEAG